ncbi:MAG: type II toxin-antitoxin system Phd/YefM family antitoxin, partial [Proteobacteria bacterium]|nr:type II toxin-antitoxin system Phd/YefM family antitoxin [Pseudomonadota bacterium]
MRIVNFSSARNNFNRILDQTVEDHDYTVITRRDKEDAVVLPLSLFNSYLETMHLLQSPKNAAHSLRARESGTRGRVDKVGVASF